MPPSKSKFDIGIYSYSFLRSLLQLEAEGAGYSGTEAGITRYMAGRFLEKMSFPTSAEHSDDKRQLIANRVAASLKTQFLKKREEYTFTVEVLNSVIAKSTVLDKKCIYNWEGLKMFLGKRPAFIRTLEYEETIAQQNNKDLKINHSHIKTWAVNDASLVFRSTELIEQPTIRTEKFIIKYKSFEIREVSFQELMAINSNYRVNRRRSYLNLDALLSSNLQCIYNVNNNIFTGLFDASGFLIGLITIFPLTKLGYHKLKNGKEFGEYFDDRDICSVSDVKKLHSIYVYNIAYQHGAEILFLLGVVDNY